MRRIVAAILQDEQGRLLILKRSAERKTFPEKWSFVSGSVEEEEKARATVVREIREEVGMNVKIELVKEGESFKDTLTPGDWIVHPFLFRYLGGAIELDREHSEYQWIEKEELESYEHVPGMKLDIEKLL